MAEQFTSIVDGFDQCQPPFCSEDFDINITQFECTGGIVYVSWAITDQYNRDWTAATSVQYSLNGENDFSDEQQISSNNFRGSSYSTFFDKPGDGNLYIKIVAQVNLLFLEGYPDNHTPLDLDTCEDISPESSLAVPVAFCPQTLYDGVPLYVKKDIIPVVTNSTNTFYFSMGGYCWFVDKNLYDSATPVEFIQAPSQAIILTSSDQFTVERACNSCALTLACPSTEWTEDPAYPGESGKDLAEIYIEYTTYNVRDEVVVYGPDPNLDCSGEEIWTSTCVGTCRGYSNSNDDCNEPGRVCNDDGEGPGMYLRKESEFMNFDNPDCTGFRISDANKDICTKQTCFVMRREQMPISVRVASKCDSDPAGTWWCAYAAGPDFEYCKCDGIDDCTTPIGVERVEVYVIPLCACSVENNPSGVYEQIYLELDALASGTFEYNGFHWVVDADNPPSTTTVISEDVTILDNVPDEFNSCWEIFNEEFIAGKTVYEVYDADDLQAMGNDGSTLNGVYVLMNDIYLDGYDWTPVGTNGDEFTGRLDGQGYVIHNLTLDDTAETFFGLFGYCSSAKFKNVGMEGIDINAQSGVAPFILVTTSSTFTNCYTKGIINVTAVGSTGGGTVGGFAGWIPDSGGGTSTFLKCYAEVDITSTHTGSPGFTSGFGGFMQSNDNTSTPVYIQCYAKGSITINGFSGGFVSKVGGFIGDDNTSVNATWRNCYASVDIAGTDLTSFTNPGQFFGEGTLASVGKEDHLLNCYSSGTITGNTGNKGGFLSNFGGATGFTSCYYNSTKSLSDLPALDVDPLTTAQMGVISNFTDWDFDGVWEMVGGFPDLVKRDGQFIGNLCDQ